MVEKYIDGPVLTRDFVETRDGNSSNVIVPAYYPVTSITEVRIDFNRAFGTSTIVDPQQTLLRGIPSLKQKSSDIAVQIKGSDIILRDDNNTAILGRIFAGSTVQSIQMKYRAGWGDTSDDLPADLVQATLMLVEYLYILRDNRDLGVNSRTNTNQSYKRNRTDTGIPEEIQIMLEQYKDYSFGDSEVPQKNYFSI
jgi:hypothetical protein